MILCDYGNDGTVCARCGHIAKSARTFRVCVPAATGDAQTTRPGTELKKLLAGWPFYITASPDCSCNARAAEMDRQGVEWCQANIETIVGWLREQATARGLPFFKAAARLLVRRAIANARK